MIQAFLNKRFHCTVVALINFISLFTFTYLVVFFGAKYFDWMIFDAPYIAVGAFCYSYIEHKSWKKNKKEEL